MNNPPNTLMGNILTNAEGCASIADAAGSLLFYTDGVTVVNASHSVMANGTGLLGQNSLQTSLIIKKPGSNTLYYLFTMEGGGGTSGLRYSLIDITLAAGQGSVTLKNIPLYPAECHESISGTKHCNGVDYWVVIQDQFNQFRSYLLTSAGVSSVAVTSTVATGISSVYNRGTIKISPNGKKLGWTCFARNSSYLQGVVKLFDFDNTTGIVSNMTNVLTNFCSYSCEFSPNSSKFYYISVMPMISGYFISQYDICSGITTPLTPPTPPAFTLDGALQLAKNGKIYCSNYSTSLTIIHNPDQVGVACGYSLFALPLNVGLSRRGLPNFMGSDFNPPPAASPPFTYTANNALGCQTASFTAPAIAQNYTLIGCAPNGYSLTNLVWNFGDPGSGAANTSTLANPTHVYSAAGTFSPMLILYYSCGGGTDTIRQVINLQPCIGVQSQSITCASLGSATVQPINGTGPLTYTWMPSNQTGSVATGLNPGTHTIYFNDANTNLTYTQTVNFIPLIPLNGILANTSSLACHGANNGTATVNNLSGGSGNQFYLWTNGSSSYTSSIATGLSAGQWSVTVTDALTACQINSVFTITQPPAQTLNISASSPTTCAGTSISFTASNSGGTPGTNPAYTYTWVGGPGTDTNTSIQNVAGNYVFTVQSSDANNCIATQTIAVDWVPNPLLSVSDVSICPLEVGTFTVSGASTYTWLPSNTAGNSFTQSAVAVGSTQYSVIGSALSCTSMATASLIVKPTPNPFIFHNSPVCENANLVFSVSSGTSAVWSGPSAFASASINNTLSTVQLNQSGVYDVTVTAPNSCTASASASLTVKPLPQFSITPSNSSICLNTTSVSLSISALSSASAYTWFPNSGLSTNSGTFVTAFPGSTTVYTLTGSLNGCTNSAQSTVNVVPPPSLTGQFSSPTLCSQAFNGSPNTITLSANGASTYSLVTIPDMFNANPAGPVSPLTSIPPYTGAGSATLSGSNGVCTVSLGLTFTVLPNPNISVNNYTPVICAGETFTYTNQGATTYTWSSATPGSTLYSNGGIAVASPTINSVFSVYGGSLGCNSALQTTTITVNPLPTVQVSPNPLLLCLGSTAELLAQSNGTSFSWLPPYGLNTYTSQQVTTHINQNQNYTVIATLNNCSNTAVAQVSILPLPVPQIVPVKDEVCLYETIHLKGEGGMYYVWTAPNLQTYTIQNLQLGMSHMALAGTYTLKVVDANACFNYSTHPVVVHDLPQGYLVPKQEEFCIPYCNSFTFVPNSVANITETGPWSLNTLLFTGNTFTNCFSKPGSFEIKGPIVDEFGCKNTVQVNVIGRPKPVAAFYVTPENPVEGLDEVSFVNVSSNVVDFGWQAIGLASIDPSFVGMTQNTWMQFKSEDRNPGYVFDEAGVYGLMLIVKNEFNCWDTVMHTIKVESDFAAYIPNAFTPNGDGLNDTFYPVMRGVKKFELQIFDRWGELIFKSTEANQVWDGSFQGQECKQDVYNYKLVLLNVKGVEKFYSGSITLYR
ncbi:MAG: gliding motility-associated C-terminal domain-containing protein [Bacteroidia bacterium]|nr:gliding motility-associated C-terminal domain-containing protein [Bacteroidia bacterium]